MLRPPKTAGSGRNARYERCERVDEKPKYEKQKQ